MPGRSRGERGGDTAGPAGSGRRRTAARPASTSAASAEERPSIRLTRANTGDRPVRRPTARNRSASTRTGATWLRSARAVGSAAAGRIEPWRHYATLTVMAALGFAVLAGLAVLPARTWWAQRSDMHETEAELEQTRAEVEGLRADLDLRATDEEIERRARADFDLVYPGEESYRILPPAAGGVPDSGTAGGENPLQAEPLAGSD
ncbi:MAG: FtsB family cell division protein [Acidimicrobiales bacterium]